MSNVHGSVKLMRSIALLACLALPATAELVDHPDIGVRLERGFRISQFSGEQLANDIWCLTLNPRGEAVVSGPGYISTLLDNDADGKADQRCPMRDRRRVLVWASRMVSRRP